MAHQDFASRDLDLGEGRTELVVADLVAWKEACDGLAASLESVTRQRLVAATGAEPW